ncbi:hypothetical protein [Winogradskyella marincola]|uniref:Uncharacterized protein n=1 Tax=Winogradskyella marincola TaxID=3037795 RepID=A0ABT6G077_9FLAO|nr:hypothetical protein [Winogradskyella sp. YYF002]MDG4715430.1 hypothetical protein [Winogradskyella sp. YYF002]
MPRLLKNDTIRLIEASTEALGLAQIGICTFRKDQLKVEQVRYSAEIGLIGSAIELAMSSILIQALGKKIIYRDYKKGKYKTASEILNDFRSLIRQASSNTLFLLNDVPNPDDHFQKLLDLTNRFQLIITSRANGLHNGYGLKYEIVASFFQDVSDFIKLIGLSNNFKPYLACIPELVGITIDKKVLIDELYQDLQQTSNVEEKRNLITSLFLILPEIPSNLPDWIEKFDSIKVAPKKNDIVYLIDALEKANPVSLNKVTDGSQSLDVKIVGRDVEGAIPISAQFLKSEFTQIKDQFYADIATANGRLKSKQLDLPPKSSINNVFALGLYDSKIIENDLKFTGHQSWPFIVEALNVAKNNTTAPYWFIIRETKDLGQLKANLKKAQRLGNSSLKKNITIVLGGIEAMENNTPIESTSVFISKILKDIEKFNNELEHIEKIYQKNGLHGLSEDYDNEFRLLFSESISISDLLQKILEDDSIELSNRKYWVAKLTLIMPEKQDLPILASILGNSDFNNAHTNIRKVFRAYDFYNYGPKIKSA